MELLQTLQVFSKVADLGSFTRAAEALGIGRPQATLAVQELEASLGVRLFHRTTRTVNLTAEGEAFRGRVSDILDDIAEATAMFGGDRAPVRGRLTIDLPVAFSHDRVLAGLRAFNLAYPDVDLVVGVTDRTVDLVAEGVDCALRIGELANSSLVAQRIGVATLVTCASPEYLERFGHPRSPADLGRHRAVNFFSGARRKVLAWQLSVDGDDQTFHVPSGILVNETSAFVRCAVAGFGLLQIPGIGVESELESGTLVEVLAHYRPRPRPVSIVYPSRVHLAPQVKKFVEWALLQFPGFQGKWLQKQ